MSNRRIRHFFVLWVVYIGKGILWERRENVGDEYKCM